MALLQLLLVEDDSLAQLQLVKMLGSADVGSQACSDAHEALRCVRRDSFDVIATDWCLGRSPLDVDGVKFLGLVRELGIRTPVLLYSARTWTPLDVARAIDAGADDYMESPLAKFDEFLARVRALVRRSSGKISLDRVRAVGVEVDVAAHVAFFDGEDLELTRGQFELLVHFLARIEEVLTYDELYAFRVGRTQATKEERAHVVQEAVRHLRARLGEGASQQLVAGVGYRLTAKEGPASRRPPTL